jgi:hypothetical protein
VTSLSNFPPGTPERELADSLQRQGFVLDGHCESDASIKVASFYAKGTGILPYATIAQAYWHTDAEGCIVWTKGFVRYSGL